MTAGMHIPLVHLRGFVRPRLTGRVSRPLRELL